MPLPRRRAEPPSQGRRGPGPGPARDLPRRFRRGQATLGADGGPMYPPRRSGVGELKRPGVCPEFVEAACAGCR
eukprot:4348286-Alexandrium_andersonii.AAC.1